jgi:hypothetical protein
MKGSISKLSRVLGAAALGGVLLASAGCEDAAEGICPGLACSDTGIAEGNASISGFAAIDTFFQSVVNFKTVANGVAADIQAELDGIRTSFAISNMDLEAADGKLGAAIRTKLQAWGQAKLVVDAQPAKCEIDAHISAQATVDCQAKANCEVDEGKLVVDCQGTCTVEASAEGKCEADAQVSCEVSGPQVSCEGQCSGSCTAMLTAAATCDGTCTGTCSGTCAGDTDTGAGCKGQCMGMCQGSCELTGMAALNCKGSCNGSCSYKPANAMCQANAKVECELKAEAKAECSGHCDGEFTPPKVECDASASCEASAKAEAKFQAKCTPPSLNIKLETSLAAGSEGRAQLDFAIADLKVRLPRLLAALKKADLVVDAGTELGASGRGAVMGTVDGIAKGDVDFVAAYRIGKCVPDELRAASTAINESGEGLAAQVGAAADVSAAIGMGS